MDEAVGVPVIRRDDESGSAGSDATLITAAQLGDERAFEEIYELHRKDIRALCSRLLRDPQAAEDLTQETFLRAFHHIDDFEPGRPLWPWLATIARRLCVDELRSLTRRRAALDRSTVHSPDAEFDVTSEEALARVERQRLGRVVSHALAGLRPRDRRVFVLDSLMGWSHEEIARNHGMSIHAVRNLAWRVRRTLRRSLSSERVGNWALLFALRVRAMKRRLTEPWKRWRVGPSGWRLQELVFERAAAVVLGFVAVSVAVIGGAAGTQPASATFVADPVRRVATSPVSAGSSSSSSRPDVRTRDGKTVSPSSMVVTSVAIAPERQRAAAPSGATLSIEVRSPGGGTLLWYENAASCGGQGASVLDPNGPITAAC